MSAEEPLSTKEETLVGIAASLAAGCRPCTRRWLTAARAEGACDRSISLAIETGLAVRDAATREMADFADAQQGNRPQVEEAFRADRTRLIEVLSCGAALAARSAVGLERHIDSARGYGATTAQISAAVLIGRMTSKMASEQAERVAERSGLDATPALSGDWCCEATRKPTAATETGCKCGGAQP